MAEIVPNSGPVTNYKATTEATNKRVLGFTGRHVHAGNALSKNVSGVCLASPLIANFSGGGRREWVS